MYKYLNSFFQEKFASIINVYIIILLKYEGKSVYYGVTELCRRMKIYLTPHTFTQNKISIRDLNHVY